VRLGEAEALKAIGHFYEMLLRPPKAEIQQEHAEHPG
jgi:hypothetical protein